ncbi:MAG: hypothetical protein M9941_03705 [Anaerolineae bacterium]|nr:hypothetical protein [Anaerolineae bacterium]MCO5196839.1 hypothetical protein [Anaerolineae bacterium]
MSHNSRESLEKRAQRAILQKAFFRWESAVILSLTVLLTLFGPDIIPIIPWWGYLLGGVVAETAMLYSSLTDPQTGQQAVAEMLRSEFQPERLRNEKLQQQIEQAFTYRSRITAEMSDGRYSAMRDELQSIADQFDDWIEDIYDLAVRLDRYLIERDRLLQNRDSAAKRILQLQRQLSAEDNAAVITDIKTNIESKERQIDTIERLDNAMERAQLRLENTVTTMGTIYTQTMLLDAKDIDSSRYKRLQHEITEEVHELEDVLVAMDDLYSSNS